MATQTVNRLFGLNETYTRNPDGSITGPYYEPSEIDDCPFDWDASKPNCRLYDPEFYKERQSKAVQDTSIPFGKHKGTPIEEIPGGYLDWMAENMTQGKSKKWSEKARDEIKRRNFRKDLL